MIRFSFVALTFSIWVLSAHSSNHIEELRSTGSLPAHVVGQFREPAVFQQAPNGDFYVFDRRAHSVFRIGPSNEVIKIVDIGPEQGRILGASSFDIGPSGRFVVADAPRGRERVQIFEPDGRRIGGFTLPGRASPRVTLDSLVLSGVGSLQFVDQTILMNQPELGGLVTRFSLNGHPFQTFGVFRKTGYESDLDVHLALNSGIPLVEPLGGYYFVFQTGVPVFRKYDVQGTLLFERHIEGPELDSTIINLPTTWPRHTNTTSRSLPIIPPTVRTATVDPDGQLWIALSVPYIYVYDLSGEKVRTISLNAAGRVEPLSLSFADRNRLLVAPGCYEFTVG